MENKFIKLNRCGTGEEVIVNINYIISFFTYENIKKNESGSQVYMSSARHTIYVNQTPNRIIDLINGKIDISILEEDDEIICFEPGAMYGDTFKVVRNRLENDLCWEFNIGGDTQYTDNLYEIDMDLKYWHRK